MQNLRPICTVLLLALVASSIAFSQAVNSTLLGTVTDSSGGAVANAQVTIKEANTGISRTTKTGDAGNYVFSDVPPGSYSVNVELAGFKKEVRSGVNLQVNETARIDLTLQLGNVTETVTITGEAALLQTDRSDTNLKVEENALANLPISTQGGRNFQVLLNLVPGTSPAAFNHSQFFNAQSSLSTHVNGISRLGNNLQFEGVDNNERTGLLQVLIPPIEALQTVDVSTGNYEAELGRAGGAVTNIILKSGTNQLHGQAYWFNRVSAVTARAFYDAARSHFVYNYVGGQVAGPVIKNKTFFFADILRQTDHRYNGDRYTLPTAAERGGDLSASTVPIYDPASGNPDGSGRIPFAGNQIPTSRIRPIPTKILSLAALPNLPGLNNNFFELIPFVRNTNQFDVKGDHNATDKDRFSVRYSHSTPQTYDGPSFGAAGGPHGGGFQGTGTQATHNGAINYDRIFSTTLISEFRVGVNRYRNDSQQVDYGTNASTALGVPGVNTGDPFVSGLVGIFVDNYSSPLVGYSASLPWIRAETNIDVVNTWTKTFSRHTIKWGVDLRRDRDDLLQTQTFSPRGAVYYGVNQTSLSGQTNGNFGNSFASFLLDLPRQSGRDLPAVFPTHRIWQFFAYAQDKWQVSQKLTIDLGVRWEFYPPMVSSHPVAGYSNYNPSNNTLVLAGVGGNPENLGMATRYRYFAPRIGFAYRLNEKTVIRGGFGISYEPYPDNQYAHNNFPVAYNNNFNPNTTYGPAVLANGQVANLSTGFPAPALFVLPSNGIITNPADASYNAINLNFKNPYVESWNLSVQRALPKNFSLDVSYVANHGVDQPNNYNLNASTVLGGDVASQPFNILYGHKNAVNFRYAGFNSAYESMQVKLNRRFSNGLQIITSYTWGKAEGYGTSDSGGVGVIEYYINPRRGWRRLDFDQRQNFLTGFVYDLPFGKSKQWANSNPMARNILGGWQMNGVLTMRTGTPLNFGGNTGGLKAPGNANTLNYFGPGGIRILNGTGYSHAWFDGTVCSASVTANCFSQPDNLQFGNLSPNVISGPGPWSLDLSLFREIAIKERFKLQLRGESFSIVNAPQWNNPDTNIGNARTAANPNGTFGFITSAGGNRQIQFGAKVIW
jgi:Carboxypeptidase regulatory-like domain